MRVPVLLLALALGACSQASPPVEPVQPDAEEPVVLEDDFAEEEVGTAPPVETIPASPEPAIPEPQYSFDNPPPQETAPDPETAEPER